MLCVGACQHVDAQGVKEGLAVFVELLLEQVDNRIRCKALVLVGDSFQVIFNPTSMA